MFKKEVFSKSQNILIKKGYKILLDLIYIQNQKIKVIDVDINFDSRIKGKSKMSLKILINLLSMILKNLFQKFYINWWARQDSNLGPIHYECTALTN